MAQTKLPPWLEKLIMQSQGPGGLGKAPVLSGAPMPRQMPLAPPPSTMEPQAPMQQAQGAMVAPQQSPQMFDFGMLNSNTPQVPTRQRPMMPELRTGQYQFPDAPTMPTMPDAPIRNVSAENRAQGKEALKAGIIGLLLGGGEGAMAAVTGTRQGMQGRANQDMSERERQFMVEMQRAQREAQAIQQDYDNRVGQVKAQMGADDDFNQRQIDLFRNENTLYNNEENRDLRESIANLTNDATLTKAQNQFLLGMAGLGPRIDNAEAAKMRAKFYGQDVTSRTADRTADNDRADEKLDFDKTFKTRQLDQVDRRIAIDESHKSWMQTNGSLRTGIQQARLNLANQKMRAGGAGGGGAAISLTPAQQRALEKDLATAALEIEKVRNGAGQKPDPTKHPDEYKLWQSRRLAAEESAAELRGFYNDQAELIGKRFDGNKYVNIPKAQAPSAPMPPIVLPDSSRATTQTTVGSPMTSIFTPPASFAAPTSPTAREQGFPSIKMPSRVTVNPAAQSGNRGAMSRAETPKPAPRATPKPSPTPKPAPAKKPLVGTQIKSKSGRTFIVTG